MQCKTSQQHLAPGPPSDTAFQTKLMFRITYLVYMVFTQFIYYYTDENRMESAASDMLAITKLHATL